MNKAFKPGINWLIVFVPICFLVNYVPALKNEIVLFVCSCLSMVVLSSLISTATEHLAARVGSKIGGLLNASFSNLPEIIFGTVALYHGLGALVKAAMTGAIIGNLLFVLGFAMLAGGLRNGPQRFSKDRASDYSTGLIIASLALFIPTVYHIVSQPAPGDALLDQEGSLSLWLAGMLFLAYVGSLAYSLFSEDEDSSGDENAVAKRMPKSSRENRGVSRSRQASWPSRASSSPSSATTWPKPWMWLRKPSD